MFGSRRRGSRGKGTALLFCSDLHGSGVTFRKLLRALETWKADVLVLGGDVAGKTLVPVVAENGGYRLSWLGEERLVDEAGLAEIEERTSNMGYYPVRTDAEGYSRLVEDETHRDRVWDEVIGERWRAWLDALERRCEDLDIRAFVMAGNDDPWSMDEIQRSWQGKRVVAADGAVVPLIDGWELASCGLANETPWRCPRDVPEPELRAKLERIAAGHDPGSSLVANIHVPPHNSGLDLAPRLDCSVDPPRPVAGASDPVGSTAVREFLETARPALSLHGHIHESPGAAKIGETLAVNPGSEYGEGILRGVRVTLGSNGEVKGHQFVSG